VEGNSLVSGLANELHFLGRQNHPDLFANLNTYNDTKLKNPDAFFNVMEGIGIRDNLVLGQLAELSLPFFSAIDPVITLSDFLTDVFTLKEPATTLCFLTSMSLCVLYYELALSCTPIALALFILYNSYYMQRFSVTKPSIARNAGVIKQQMQIIIALRPKIDKLVSDVIFWGKPSLSTFVVQLAIPLSLATLIGLYAMPFRWMVAFGLWVPVLSQIEFFKVLGQAVTL
jgi:hypothetical protein